MKKFYYVWAPWCGPCKFFAPTIEKLAKTYTVVKINADEPENKDFMLANNILSIPTVLLEKDGKIVHVQVGGKSEQFYIDLYNNF